MCTHAGQEGLLQYAQAAQEGGVKEIFLVHGEEDAAKVFEQLLTRNGITSFSYPARGQVAEI